MDRKKEKLKKLYELSKRGCGGEKVNAEKALNRLLKKYGMTLGEIQDSEEKKLRDFTVHDKHQETLLAQLFFKVLINFDGRWFRHKKKRAYNMTDFEYFEIKTLFDIYKKDMKRVIDMAVEAFIHANNIFGKSEAKDKRVSKKEEDKIRKMLKMAGAIEASKIYKRLT